MAAVIIVMGPPGAGKGTQSEILARRDGWLHISTGQLVRQSEDEKLLAVANRGELIASEDMEELLLKRLDSVDNDQTVVLDGFPRLVDEAKWLDETLKTLGWRLQEVIYLTINQDQSRTRNLKRGRVDDSPTAQTERWQEFERDTLPVIERFRAAGILKEVDGVGTVDEVAQRIRQVI